MGIEVQQCRHSSTWSSVGPVSRWPSNSSMQRTALRAAADAERWASHSTAVLGPTAEYKT